MVAVAPGVAAAANEADASISSVSRQTVAEPRRGASCHANVSESSSTPLSSNDAPTTSGSETGSQEGSKRPHPLPAKSCKGCLYFSNMRAARGGKPLCIGLSRKEEEQGEKPCGSIGRRSFCWLIGM